MTDTKENIEIVTDLNETVKQRVRSVFSDIEIEYGIIVSSKPNEAELAKLMAQVAKAEKGLIIVIESEDFNKNHFVELIGSKNPNYTVIDSVTAEKAIKDYSREASRLYGEITEFHKEFELKAFNDLIVNDTRTVTVKEINEGIAVKTKKHEIKHNSFKQYNKKFQYAHDKRSIRSSNRGRR